MLDIGWSELLIVGVVALIVVGPKDLPRMFHTFGQVVGKARGMAREFQNAMEDAAKEPGVKDAARKFRDVASGKDMGLEDFRDIASGKPWKPAMRAAARSDAKAAQSAKATANSAVDPTGADEAAADEFDAIDAEFDKLHRSRGSDNPPVGPSVDVPAAQATPTRPATPKAFGAKPDANAAPAPLQTTDNAATPATPATPARKPRQSAPKSIAANPAVAVSKAAKTTTMKAAAIAPATSAPAAKPAAKKSTKKKPATTKDRSGTTDA